MAAGLLVALALAASPSSACRHEDGYLDGPFVPDAATAESIYRAVRAKQPHKRFPVIRVSDEGDRWFVSEDFRRPHPRMFGGGQSNLHIDKCSGAVSHASYNR